LIIQSASYYEGFYAYFVGKPKESNPYTAQKGTEWLHGWNEAYEKMKENKKTLDN